MIKLADVRMFLFQNLKLNRATQAQTVRMRLKEIRDGLAAARKMNLHVERYPGELAFKIGGTLYLSFELAGADAKQEARDAKRELDASLESIRNAKMTTEMRKSSGAEQARNDIEMYIFKDAGFLKMLEQ
jgi:hypothetical protein